jgi:ArsR family transcriptional regulator, arsenate/arsenite/antimonite-responsive transcriptional repressor
VWKIKTHIDNRLSISYIHHIEIYLCEEIMNVDFARGTEILKALADETRVRIVHILSCGELCACDIQTYFNLTQPTLSHHLKLLTDAGLILARKEGKWTHYRLSHETLFFFQQFWEGITVESDTCECKKIKKCCKKDSL